MAFLPLVDGGAYSAWTCVKHHRHPMVDPGSLAEKLPIGPGVTEAICSILV